MTWQAWFTTVVIAGVIFAIARGRTPPSAAIIGGVLVLLIARVLTPEQAFAGFSNPAVVTVAALAVIARGVMQTQVLAPVVASILGIETRWRHSLTRLLLASASASAFLNNTPLVAMLAPAVTDWSDRSGKAPSRLLLPMSFAISLGGMVTLMGTSTNVIVSGLVESSGRTPFGMFELARLGIPVAVLGIAVLVVSTPILLSERSSAWDSLAADAREFAVQMVVIPAGGLEGKTVEAAGLRHLEGVFLVEVERHETVIAPVAPTTLLEAGDVLTFVGKSDNIVDLQRCPGLASREQEHVSTFDTRRHPFYEAVVGPSSPLLGKSLKEAQFRGRYHAAVVAIQRAGERIRAKLGTVKLRSGDMLLFIADAGFRRNDFLFVNRVGGRSPITPRRGAALTAAVVGAVMIVAGSGLLPILQASLVGAAVLVLSGVLTPIEAREAIDIDVLAAIAGSFALGTALATCGLAARFARLIITLCEPMGPRGPLLGLAIATLAISQILTCNAAAVLAFPLASAVASETTISLRGAAAAVAIAASASFATPIGYQTKMMVYGPGGYHFGDFVRLGLPLVLLVAVVIVFVVPVAWPV